MPARALTRNTLGEHLSPVMESAKETVVAISRLLRSATCPTASVEPLVDGAGQEIDLVHLEQLLGLLHRDGGLASSSS
jgi:hypothetical protein